DRIVLAGVRGERARRQVDRDAGSPCRGDRRTLSAPRPRGRSRMRGVFKELKGIIHRSVAERGTLQTLKYGVTRGPRYLQKIVRQLFDATRPPSEFDRRHGVRTDGDHGGATLLRTLRIDSPNWMQGEDYGPVDPERFRAALSALPVPVDGY